MPVPNIPSTSPYLRGDLYQMTGRMDDPMSGRALNYGRPWTYSRVYGNNGQQGQGAPPRSNPWATYQVGPNAGQPIRPGSAGGGTQGAPPSRTGVGGGAGSTGGRTTQSTRGQVSGGAGSAAAKPSRDGMPVNGYRGSGYAGGGGAASQPSGPALDALGHGDYGPGYDSLGHAAFGGGNDFLMSDDEKKFNEYKRLGLVDWTGSYRNWEKNGSPRAGQYTPEQMAAIVSGHRDPYDFNYGQAGGVPGGAGVPPTGAPGSLPGPTTGAPGGSGYSPSPGYIPPQNAADWQNPGNVASLNYWQGLAGDVNQWNMDQWNSQWGADQNKFAMDQSNAAMQMDWLMNQDNLNFNYWNSMLGADANAYDSAANLYANLDRNQAEAWANAYGADAGLYGNMYGADANLAGGMYGTNINAMNDWYTNQLRAQTDKEIATMQAFGRDQLPNTRFLQNWT